MMISSIILLVSCVTSCGNPRSQGFVMHLHGFVASVDNQERSAAIQWQMKTHYPVLDTRLAGSSTSVLEDQAFYVRYVVRLAHTI